MFQPGLVPGFFSMTYNPHQDHTGTDREFGCESCKHFGGWIGVQLAVPHEQWSYDGPGQCNHPSYPGVIATPTAGCVFWIRSPVELP